MVLTRINVSPKLANSFITADPVHGLLDRTKDECEKTFSQRATNGKKNRNKTEKQATR